MCVKELALELENVNKRESIRGLGMDAYNPRILKSTNKDDILNQVVYILNEEE